MKIAGLFDDKPKGQDALLDNYIVCHCGQASRHCRTWEKCQEWWRQHGFGKVCGQ